MDNEAEDNVEDNAVHIFREADVLLQVLCAAAENGGGGAPVTLLVGGAIVTGEIIGAKQFYEAVGMGDVWVAFHPNGDEDKPPALSRKYIHLENVQIFLGGAAPIPTGETIKVWRGKLSEVSGFNTGRLMTEAKG
ncbi:hypothetical protein OE699_10685 [Sedimentimonas flavescens]|uniref:Uncharacterized protein n=1 Tax=Sedimentimonas flavescens TaxID=2851012 RepID=A0ABT2ZZY8_9RHOB|nr:hypothetical protein [Sedimentimonas flavescens]MCV2879322.1 hypothetical protein [Sedimentimonas flavescens]